MTTETSQGQELAKPKAPSMMNQLQVGLQGMAAELKTALPSNISADRFIATAITGIRTAADPKKLLQADRRSLYNAVQMAASYGLILDGREAALVPFGDKVQFMPMVQGLVKLARNSGVVSTVIAEVVYKNDPFRYSIGVDDAPVHEPDWFSDDRGEPVGVWALVKLSNGDKIHAIMPKSRVMQIASGSKNSGQYNCQTGKHWQEWWKKTAIKNVLKYAPKATELDRINDLSTYDDSAEGVTADGEIVAETAETKKKPQTRAATKVKTDAAATMKAAVEEGLLDDDKGPTKAKEEEIPGHIIDADYTESSGDDDSYDDDEIPA